MTITVSHETAIYMAQSSAYSTVTEPRYVTKSGDTRYYIVSNDGVLCLICKNTARDDTYTTLSITCESIRCLRIGIKSFIRYLYKYLVCCVVCEIVYFYICESHRILMGERFYLTALFGIRIR